MVLYGDVTIHNRSVGDNNVFSTDQRKVLACKVYDILRTTPGIGHSVFLQTYGVKKVITLELYKR